MTFRSSFIPATVWNMSKGVDTLSRLTSTSNSKVHFFFAIGFCLSYRFHSSFFFFVLSSSCGTLPFFFWFLLFSSDGALTFFFFILALIIELYFRFLVSLGRVTVGGCRFGWLIGSMSSNNSSRGLIGSTLSGRRMWLIGGTLSGRSRIRFTLI